MDNDKRYRKSSLDKYIVHDANYIVSSKNNKSKDNKSSFFSLINIFKKINCCFKKNLYNKI